MTTIASNGQPRPLASRPIAAAPPAPAPAPVQNTDRAQQPGFARQFELATEMMAVDRDAAIGLYWKALRLSRTVDDAMLVVDASFGRMLGMTDLRAGAMNKVLLLINGHTQSLNAAAALHGKGQSADDWAVAALRKALETAKTPEEAMAVASFAKENGRFLRYRGIAEEATSRARVLASSQGR